MMDRIRCTIIILTLLSIGFVIGGILLFTCSNSIIKKAVRKECELKPGTVVYQLWRDTPVPLYISIYVFDLANENEFLNGGRPNLIQRGPFVYKDQRTKTDIRLYPNGTISYRELRNYTFDRTKSSNDETFRINTINVVYMTLINYLEMQNIPSAVRKIIGIALSFIEKPVMQRTVKEYLWGYQDPILNILKKELPQLVSDDQVSVFGSVVNEAQYETILINNGIGLDENHIDRINNLGKIERFNFSTNLSIWSNKYANMINGTDSTIWHPETSQTERIYTYISDICRSVYLEFNQTRDNQFNIKTYRYTLPSSAFSNSTQNQGFCLNPSNSNKTHEIECLPSGLFSLKTCVHLSGGSVAIPLPIIASNPHFLEADSSVQKAVDGLVPDDIKHRSFVDIEPMTGIVMNGSRRLQININVVNDSSISEIARVKPVVFPMIWIDEHAEIDQTSANTFYKNVTTPVTILNVIKYLLLGIGIALFVIVIGLLVYRRHKKNMSGDPFPPVDDTERLASHF